MENIVHNSIMKQSLLNAIEREKILIKKYNTFFSFIKDDATKELFCEFENTAREHIDLLKEKFRTLDI